MLSTEIRDGMSTCEGSHLPLPPPSVSARTNGSLPPSAVAQNSQLLIQTVDKSINTTFICRVTNALGTGQAELTIQVRGEEPFGWQAQRDRRRRSQQDSL